MYGKVKLTKRQIKEDKFTTFMLNAKHQFLENWQYYVMGIAVVILVIAAVVYYFDNQATRQQEAAERFSRALLDYRSGNADVALLNLNEVLTEYSGGFVAEQATFLLAKLHYGLRNYPEALRYYDMYVSQFKDDKLLRASAIAGIAACYENQGNYFEAAEQFGAAVKEYPDGPLAGDHRVAAMRNLLMTGQMEAARTYYDEIREKYQGTELERRATRLFSEKSHI
jgi:TolA-binding protein